MSSEDEAVAIHIFLMSSAENWCKATELVLVLLRVFSAGIQKSGCSVSAVIESGSIVTNFCKKVYYFRGL